MKINVLLSPLNADELFFTGKTTVVIDVLRATTTITACLAHGAKELIPVDSIEFAMKVSGNAFGGQTILGGERNTKKIEGFTLGNSPIEYTSENVAGKSIIFFTTNGTKAIVRAKFSEHLLLCSFNNLNAVAQYLLQLNNDVNILCAGSNGMFCVEDTVCAGMLIKAMTKMNSELEIADAGKASVILNDNYGDSTINILKDCEHGVKLISNGFEDDVEYCAQLDTTNIIPVYKSGVFKPLNFDQR